MNYAQSLYLARIVFCSYDRPCWYTWRAMMERTFPVWQAKR